MKQKVQDKYRYCSTRRKVLLDHVAEGYECDYWLVFIHVLCQHKSLTIFVCFYFREYNQGT